MTISSKMKMLLGFLVIVWSGCAMPATVTFRPGEIWPDNDGQNIQAHGGAVIHLGDTFYWFGEDRARSNPENLRCISCYSSKDLTHWRHRGQVLKRDVPVMERPKVFYNAKTKKFVMYVHIDGPVPGMEGDYNVARVGVAVCDTVDGQYHFLKSFRPLGHESRDIGQFIDDDGTAYLLSEDRPNGFHIYKLSDDYLSIAKDVCMVPEHLEGLGLVHYDGLYYVVGSSLTGWNPNPNVYATARSLAGPWSEVKNIAPPETKTYGSQSSYLLKIEGTKATNVIFMADIWEPQTQWDSRYLWMPLKIGDGKMWLPRPRPWTLDLKTGETVMEPAGGTDAESDEDSGEMLAGSRDAGLNVSDIGSPAMSGSASYTNGVWTVAGGGSDIWLAGDQFSFLTNSLNGDGAVIARVNSQTDTDPWALAGIMIRNDISESSPEVSLLLTAENGITFRYRSVAGGETVQSFKTGVASPQWIRLSRSGNTFTANYSADGIHWKQLGEPQTVAMSKRVLAGLAVSAHNNALLNTATFIDFLIVPGPQAGVPADLYNHWDDQRAFVWETTWPLPQLNVAHSSPAPTMGWNSWQVVGDTPGPSEYLITNTANALVANGLAAAGYKTVTIDCTWIASGRGYRDTNGNLIVDTNCWPDGMKAVADYVHSKGLRMGGYSDIGSIGYGNPPHVQVGMYPNYQQDADQFAAWGWDFIKIDDHGAGDFYAACHAIANNASHRPIVLSLSTPQVDRLQFGNRIANSYRVGNDITFKMGEGNWKSIVEEFDLDQAQWFAQAPGHWNDPDMLCIGLKGVSNREGRSHFNMWCVLGAPLIIGTDLRTNGTPYHAPLMTAATLNTLTNAEVIAVDQDPLGAVGRPVGDSTAVYAKPLGSFTSGQFAVLLLNRSETSRNITVNWQELGLIGGRPAQVRDLWAHQDLGSLNDGLTGTNIPPHGSMMLKVTGDFDWNRPRTYEAESAYNTFSGAAYYVPRNPNFSSGAYVTGIGNDEANTLRFNRVAAPADGIYKLEIYYACAADCQAQLRVNGNPATTLAFAATGGDTNQVGVLTVSVPLQAGLNQLTFGNPSGPAPNLDKIVVSCVTTNP